MNLKLVEWNIHKMRSKAPSPLFVSTYLKSLNADILCLTEYTHDEGVIKALEKDYWLEESVPLSGNQILIGVKRVLISFETQKICDIDERDCYNFLHISFLPVGMKKKLSIIGIRMLTGKGKHRMDARKQTPPLVKYLSNLNEPFLCTGDFNIKRHRMSKWFPGYGVGDLIEKKNEIDNSSYVFTDEYTYEITDFGILDHILHSKDFKINVEYDWGFISHSAIYPPKDFIMVGREWGIDPLYPDHGMLLANISWVNEVHN